MMKKSTKFAIWGSFIICLFSLCYAEQNDALKRLNQEVYGIYGIENFFVENAGDYGAFNMEVLTKYNIPVYGDPTPSELTSIGTNAPRFIGVNDLGESVPNPKFPADSLTHTRLNDFKWIENPCEKEIVRNNPRFKKIEKSRFDTPAIHQKLVDNIINSLDVQFNHKIYNGQVYNKFDKAEALKHKADWLNRFHIVVPPTNTTFGSAVMFHLYTDSGGNTTLYYIDLVLQPLSNDGKLHIEYQDENGDVLPDHSEDIVLKAGETITVSHKEIAGYTYEGLGYSFDHASPEMNSLKPQQEVYYKGDAQNAAGYLVFYFKKEPLTPAADTVTGEIRLINDQFDVGKGIPTGEQIDIEATLSDPIVLDYAMQQRQGTETYHVNVSYTYSYMIPSQQHPNKEIESIDYTVTDTFTLNRAYSYYELMSYYYASLKYLTLHNTKIRYLLDPVKLYLSDGGIEKHALLLTTDSEHIKPPQPSGNNWSYDEATKTFSIENSSYTYTSKPSSAELSSDLLSFAEQVIPEVRVRNDLLMYGDNLLSDGDWHAGAAPKPLDPPKFGPAVLKIKDFDIEHWVKNGFSKTTGTLQYITESSYHYNGTVLDKVDIKGNPITIHTPVVNQTNYEEAARKFDQRSSSTPEKLMPVDVPIKMTFRTSGMHRDIKGYRDREYREYVKYKRVQFPFDVFLGKTEADVRWEHGSCEFIEKNTWHELPLDVNDFYLKAAPWAETGVHSVYTQVVAKNHRTPASAEFVANIDLNRDIAMHSERVVVTGRLFDFQVNAISDKRWHDMFNTLDARIGKLFFGVGSNNKNGELSVRAQKTRNHWPYTLPIKPDKNISKGYEDAAIRLGDAAYFSVKSMGDYYHKTDGIVMIPTFYHVDENYANRQPVDLYYKNGHQKYVKIGDYIANYKLITNASLAPNLTKKIKKETVSTVYQLMDLGIYNANSPDQMFVNEGFAFDCFAGYLDAVSIGATKRVFIGQNRNFFSRSNPTYERAGTQMWLGKYQLPDSTIAVPKDANFIQDYKFGRERIFKNGYIVVSFDIDLIKLLNYRNPDISYITDHSNEWALEGFDSSEDMYGDVLYFHVDKHTTDILKIK